MFSHIVVCPSCFIIFKIDRAWECSLDQSVLRCARIREISFFFPNTGSERRFCYHLTHDPTVCWYYQDVITRKWGDALEDCARRGGFLAIEHDATLGRLMRHQLQNQTRRTPLALGFYIGLRRNSFGNFVWADGKTYA